MSSVKGEAFKTFTAEKIQQIAEKIETLDEDQDEIQQLLKRTTKNSVKVRSPERFNGDRRKLRDFIIKCKLYLKLRKADFEDEAEQAYFIASLLEGTAFS